MVSLRVDAESFGNLAEQLEICSKSLKQDIDTAERLLSTIDSSWSGEELRSFTAKAQHSTTECQQLSDTLYTLAMHLKGIYEQYQQSEQCLLQNLKHLSELN